jgi:hypothetical protein
VGPNLFNWYEIRPCDLYHPKGVDDVWRSNLPLTIYLVYQRVFPPARRPNHTNRPSSHGRTQDQNPGSHSLPRPSCNTQKSPNGDPSILIISIQLGATRVFFRVSRRRRAIHSPSYIHSCIHHGVDFLVVFGGRRQQLSSTKTTAAENRLGGGRHGRNSAAGGRIVFDCLELDRGQR